MWAELGERVNAEGKMMRGKYWGNAEEARENKNPAEPWGLRDENCILLILLVVSRGVYPVIWQKFR